ncbi:MAG: hypothetical protein MUF24_04110 [Chitinophagaceae bacterium]|jgi:hypothetical protein|nr:hypothetical protein [Chitinophagaceae bacterium]
MAFVSNTVQPNTEAQPAENTGILSPELGILLAGAVAGTAAARATRKQYKKMMRRLTWKMIGLKFKSMLGFRKNMPDDVMGLNFWVFVGLVALLAIIGAAIFGVTGFLILLGIGIIIYLLLNGN